MNPKIEKILNYKSIPIRQKIDRLLELDAINYTNLGSESTKTQREEVKKESRFIYRAIKTLDTDLGNLFLQHQDK